MVATVYAKLPHQLHMVQEEAAELLLLGLQQLPEVVLETVELEHLQPFLELL
jgi:hypothetical protein